MAVIAIVLLVLLCIYLSAREVPQMLSKKYYSDFCVFSVLMLCDLTIGILLSLNIKVPNPAELPALIFAPFRSFMEQIMK